MCFPWPNIEDRKNIFKLNGDGKMGNTNKGKNARERVFEFYATHATSCNSSYTTAEDEKINMLYHDVKDKCEQSSLFAQTSIVILTANKYERNILHKKIYESERNPIQRMEIELFTACQRFKKAYAYWFKWNNYSILNIHANVTGSYTIGGSADIVRWVLLNEYLFPTAIISFGICFGSMVQNSELGEVVISRKVYPYFIGAKLNGKRLAVVDDNAFLLNDSMDNRIHDLDNNNQLNKFDFNVMLKNYITGEAVVSSKVFRDKFVNITTQEIYAGDMEGYGLFKECTSYPYNVPCVIIKSICDWAEEKNFNKNDEEVLNEFKTSLYNHNTEIDIDEKELLGTLKDRLQAYSASCAFEVLKVVIQNQVVNEGMLDFIRTWIANFHGKATTCRKVRSIVLNKIRTSNLGLTVSDSFIHRCLMILEDEGVIKCDSACKLNQKGNDICLVPELKASIDIIREG